MIYSDEERKFNTEITIALIHSDLLNLAEYNVHLAKLIDGGRNSMFQALYWLACSFIALELLLPFRVYCRLIDFGDYHFSEAALEFSISLVEELVVQESGVSMSELHNLIDALAKACISFCYENLLTVILVLM